MFLRISTNNLTKRMNYHENLLFSYTLRFMKAYILDVKSRSAYVTIEPEAFRRSFLVIISGLVLIR